MKAHIFDLYRLSHHDGPGLRTVLFLKGCPLRCRWCHNPESFKQDREIWTYREKCISCGLCLSVCPETALSLEENGIKLDRQRCSGCLKCTTICPSRALKPIGTEQSLDEIMKLILREKPFMSAGSGGLTVSGGEPLMQADFVRELFMECGKQGIHRAVDTSGQIPWKSLEKVLPHTDLVLYDIKHMNEIDHKSLTRAGNRLILENFLKLCDYREQKENVPDLRVRTPVIPGATAALENIAGIGEFLKTSLKTGINRWELCAFNPLAGEKYSRLGLSWDYNTKDLLPAEEFRKLIHTAEQALGTGGTVYSSGLTSGD